jgi:hypothetical protein
LNVVRRKKKLSVEIDGAQRISGKSTFIRSFSSSLERRSRKEREGEREREREREDGTD